jgi:hypothetical protein
MLARLEPLKLVSDKFFLVKALLDNAQSKVALLPPRDIFRSCGYVPSLIISRSKVLSYRASFEPKTR